MGASGWAYFVPYQDDAEAALQALRQSVFEIYPDDAVTDGPTNSEYEAYLATLPADQREVMQRVLRVGIVSEKFQRAMGRIGDVSHPIYADAQRVVELMRKQADITDADVEEAEAIGDKHVSNKASGSDQSPGTIEELLMRTGESGTHTIMDIERTGEKRELGVASPMPEPLVIELYGSARPTRSQIEANQGAASDTIGRYEAYYVTVYDGDKPTEIYFEGVSGD